MTALRRPGSPWRLLAYTWIGKRKDGQRYGDSWTVDNTDDGYPAATWTDHLIGDTGFAFHETHLSGTEFDELAVGTWLHAEAMSGRRWVVNIGGVVIWVTARKDGSPKHVTVYGPHDYDQPRDRCIYELNWTSDGEQGTGEAP